MKMQHCLISVTLTYTDDSSVKKLVRLRQFTAAICFYILLTQLTEPPQFQARAGFRHDSGKYAGGSWVKVHRPMTHMTHSKKLTHRPIVYSAGNSHSLSEVKWQLKIIENHLTLG